MNDIPKKTEDRAGLSRREFMALASGAAIGAMTGSPFMASAAQSAAPAIGAGQRPMNQLFIFTDQERYFPSLPGGLDLPGHERLARNGVTFHQHYCPAVMCTSSRAVLLTGLQTRDNRMFENCDLPYVRPLSTEVPTIGHMLRKAGYYTAYKGKWHLNPEFDRDEPDRLLTKEMDAYGFSDFVWPGDVLTHALGGYTFDHMIAGSAISWMRRQGRRLNDEGKPWALFVSLVNPHDIMYFNTDAPGEQVQDNGRLLMHAARGPDHPLFRTRWEAPLPPSLRQAVKAPDRPGAHAEFRRAWGYVLGDVPPDEERWQRFSDYYLNSLRSVDAHLASMLDELSSLGLADSTVVTYTSDHGEMGGAHGLRGKGPFAYQEAIHLPMYIVHPDVKGGQDCRALTGHIDMVPTLLSMAGVSPAASGELAGRELPGKDLGALLTSPGSADVHAVRDAVLFTYSGLSTNDSELIRLAADAKAAGSNPKEVLEKSGYKPNLRNRGSLRTVFDGRHKFTRYFSPIERNRPKDLASLFAGNDVELFDLKNDPGEMTNLAAASNRDPDLFLAMNAKLETIIKAEFGVDDGREMPDFGGINWTLDRMEL